MRYRTGNQCSTAAHYKHGRSTSARDEACKRVLSDCSRRSRPFLGRYDWLSVAAAAGRSSNSVRLSIMTARSQSCIRHWCATSLDITWLTSDDLSEWGEIMRLFSCLKPWMLSAWKRTHCWRHCSPSPWQPRRSSLIGRDLGIEGLNGFCRRAAGGS